MYAFVFVNINSHTNTYMVSEESVNLDQHGNISSQQHASAHTLCEPLADNVHKLYSNTRPRIIIAHSRQVVRMICVGQRIVDALGEVAHSLENRLDLVHELVWSGMV